MQTALVHSRLSVAVQDIHEENDMAKYYKEGESIDSFQDFVRIIETFAELFDNNFELSQHLKRSHVHKHVFYRGQKDSEWELIPSLFREKIKNDTWENHGEELLSDFKRQSLPHLQHLPSGEYDNDMEWLAIGQHHGLLTNLLDWSTNALIALYFATEDKNTDGSFWIALGSNTISELDGKEIVQFYNPSATNRFIEAQAACFSIHNYPEDSQPFPSPPFLNCSKLIVNKESKVLIRQKLRFLGIHEFSVYPSLGGLARYLSK